MSKNFNGIIRYYDSPRTNSVDRAQRQNSINNTTNSTSKEKIIKKIIIGAVICFAIAGVAVIAILLTRKKDPPPYVDPSTTISTTTNVVNLEDEERKLGSEFEFNTKKGDLKRIHVRQKYSENRVRDGEKITTFLFRDTNYDIYIINEQDSDEENKYYYDKLYTCSISIQSECYSSTDENCELQKMVDLTNSARRNLEENNNNDLKDIPLPICFFNLTNNDVITSISCPESLPETERRKIVLDLYFFRPPGLKRLTENNIDNEITRKTVGNRKYIKETNEGICDIENGQFSHCTTDMNTITDLENNILFYDEEAVMNITIDANNSNIKTKITNLTDESSKIGNLNPQIYEEKLNNIIQKLNPYLKYEVLFSKDDFKEYYVISKNGSDALNQKRILDNIEDKIIKEENNLFNQFFSESGITVVFNLINNAGINTDFMEANSKLKIETINEDVSNSKESSRSFNQIIKGLYLLSKAGNHLATEFYQKINTTLEEMIEKINQEFTSLNELVRYKDFSDIFDSTLSLDELNYLPFKIIQASTNLNQNLNEIINNVENGGIKQNIKILNQNIYDYIEESHIIINGLFNNLNELNTVLSSPKSKLTKISTYYLNNTSTSYISIIEKAKTILNNYYKDEYNLILQEFDSIKKEFEKKITESVSKEMKIIDILYEKIENKNFTIKQANDDDIKTILNNLYETKNYLKKIKEKIIDKLTKEMDKKSNGYFISDYDMRSNQESFSKILEKTTKICEELDNNENIDRVFDEIMTNMKRNFTKILKYMDQQKEELFPLNEDVLKQSTFTLEIQNKMENDISQVGLEILNKIKRENNYYLESKEKAIKEFLDKNKEDLDKKVLELDNLFSMAKLDKLAQLYEEAFNSSLEKTKNEINGNYLLSNQYFSTLSDENEIKKILRNYHTDDNYLPKYYKNRPLTDFTDNIYYKVKTQGYLSKYNIFKDNFEKSKLYINEQLYRDLLSEYQSFILKIREILQVFKNNKISDKYPDLNELSFIDDHIRTINTFYNRLNVYISDEIFNNKFIDIINNFKKTENKLIENYIGDMESKHNIINSFPYMNNYNTDFCLWFSRKKTYTCPNGAVSLKTNSDAYCFPADSISSNYLKLSKHSIETDLGVLHFRSEFKQFNDLLNEKIYYYTSKINEIKQSLLDIESETIKNNFTLEYLYPLEDSVSSLLSNKYGDKIVNSSYNYYQSDIREKIEPLLNNISFQWKQYFQSLYINIQNKRNNFTSSIADLPNMAMSYLSILNNNITKNYFNSIVKHQKSEFNYTIAYYYNILLKLVKSSHQNVINKLPSNPIGFNNIINKRKEEVNVIFNELIKNIEDSKNEALNLGQQLYILYVPETNFFKVNDILRNNDLNNNNILSPILSNIYAISSNKENDEFSLSSRYYLENSEIGRQIQELYKQIVEKVFVYLNLENFKNLLKKNWIFDQDGFIKNLNDILYNSNLEIQKELKLEKEKYYSSLEQEIKKTYTKEEISQKINENYKTGVKKLELNQINEVKKNINDILDKIKQEFTEEANLLKQTSNSYNKNFTKIQERLINYKSQIIENLKTKIFGVINAFYQDINNKININYCEPKLDEYISDTKNTTSQFGEIELLNSSYNIGEIIENMIKSIVNNYKNFIQNEIKSNYDETYSEIKKEYENQNLENLIKEKIDEYYNSILFPTLKEIAKYDIGIEGYNEYDLNDNIIKNINEVIDTKINNIKNIVETTKGINFEVDVKKWEIFDFSSAYIRVNDICKSFEQFISSERDNEKEKVDNFLKDILISNFNEMLENIIPSFGNSFFERIIFYNENFKISSLYDNLIYCLNPSLAYYLILKSFAKIDMLTKDLKLKIFSLNDLDLTAQEKNKEVLDLLNQKVNEFIEDSQDFFINEYKKYFNNDVSIETSFNSKIREEIIKNLYEVQNIFNDNYFNYMNKYFKEKLISSYTKVMNQKTKEMVLNIAEKRETLKLNLDDLFSLEPDAVLNEINNKINNTLYSINRFYAHNKTIQFSETLKVFLNNFGTMNIQPKFNVITEILNYETKDIIAQKIDENYFEYKNYYDKKFVEKVNLTEKEIETKFISNITEAINNYGEEEYPNNLENEINRQSQKIIRRRRRLLTEEEIINDYKEKIADKALDETLSKILISSNNTKRFIDNYENFDIFDKTINDNINKINIAYKKSLKLIQDNYYSEEIYNELYIKLMNLKNFTLDYFSSVNESFNYFKTYLKTSIIDINNKINKCANLTYITFSEKYDNYINLENINLETDDNLGIKSDSDIVQSQNHIIEVNYTISQILQKTQFKVIVEYKEEGGIKKPIITLIIINESRPKKISLQMTKPQGLVGDIIENVNIEPNKVNFTMCVYYNTKSKDLNVTTVTDFESYKYNTELIQISVKQGEPKCIWVEGTPYCYPNVNPEVIRTIISSLKDITIIGKKFIRDSIVHESRLFD